MEKFELIFNANPLFKNNEEYFDFEGLRINLYKKDSEKEIISELGVVIEEENEDCAEKMAYSKIEELNNFFIFKKNINLIELPLNCKKTKFLDRKTQTVTREFPLRYDIINKISFNELLCDYEEYKPTMKIISLYSDAEKVRDKELKFLAYYKVLEFQNNPDAWLESRGEVKISVPHGREKTTEITFLRHSICHPRGENIEIKKEHLEKIKKFAKERIKELVS